MLCVSLKFTVFRLHEADFFLSKCLPDAIEDPTHGELVLQKGSDTCRGLEYEVLTTSEHTHLVCSEPDPVLAEVSAVGLENCSCGRVQCIASLHLGLKN